MKLVPRWGRVLGRSLSMWSVYLAAALETASAVLPYVGDRLPWWAPIAILCATPLLRIVNQGGLDAD